MLRRARRWASGLMLGLCLLTACSPGEPADTRADRPDRAAEPPGSGSAASDPAGWLFVWAGDLDRSDPDFLAVLDADRGSPDYGRVVTTLPVEDRGTMPHHTEHRMPESRTLFANGFRAGITYRFDLSDPREPRLLGSFRAVDSLTHPHSYERLPGGDVLATFQGRGGRNVDPGGLARIGDGGGVVATASAADASAPGGALLRPYSLAIVPALDRVVTTNYDMGEDIGMRGGRRGRTDTIQVWRLSDLAPVATIRLPAGPKGYENQQPGEPRLLEDGETVLVATFTCGLYRVTGLGGEAPSAEFVHGFDGGGCALPVVLGRWWIQSVPSAHAVVTLDVSDPAAPREVDRLTLGGRNFPHWLALDGHGQRIVITDRGDGERRIFLATIDPETGELALDEAFRDPGAGRPGVSFDRSEWPHGVTGAAKPHGAVFGF
ncbi:MAG: selenium-binding family protein [Gemmatimonadetes bacterium]|nr:selenium-binding family protein [Gemmatimonadota bacterium]